MTLCANLISFSVSFSVWWPAITVHRGHTRLSQFTQAFAILFAHLRLSVDLQLEVPVSLNKYTKFISISVVECVCTMSIEQMTNRNTHHNHCNNKISVFFGSVSFHSRLLLLLCVSCVFIHFLRKQASVRWTACVLINSEISKCDASTTKNSKNKKRKKKWKIRQNMRRTVYFSIVFVRRTPTLDTVCASLRLTTYRLISKFMEKLET